MKSRQIILRKSGIAGYDAARQTTARLQALGYAADYGNIPSPAGSFADDIYVMTDAPRGIVRREAKAEGSALKYDTL